MTVTAKVPRTVIDVVDLNALDLLGMIEEARLTYDNMIRLYVDSPTDDRFIMNICDIPPADIGCDTSLIRDDDELLKFVYENIKVVYEYLDSINLEF